MKTHLYFDGDVRYTNVSCEEIFNLMNWRDAKVVTYFLLLTIMNTIVIVGNCMVIVAVFISAKLRTVTNLFIVSLAVADLMVGLAVLPFSATWEIFEVWIFGEVWCSMWLAVDVWMCTASILNLCAISLDRYVAVTRPVNYPTLMSATKAKLLIGAVWILSFLICFPPLVGWNDRKRTFYRQLITNSSDSILIEDYETGGQFDLISSSIRPIEQRFHVKECTLTCELTNDKGYVVYSAMGSFFLPMLVMLFFYWKIYRAAVETTKAINQGFRTTKGSRLLGTRFEEQRLTLRIHRGRSVQTHRHHSSNRSASPNPSSASNGRLLPNSSPGGDSSHLLRSRSQKSERVKVHLTPPPPRMGKRPCQPKDNTSSIESRPSPGGSPSQQLDSLSLPATDGSGRRLINVTESDSSIPSPVPAAIKHEALSSSSTEDAKPRPISKMGRRNIKVQVKRFRMETKAAKTLGIIVGCFIVCWLPFFTMYVWRAFCDKCIPRLVFSIFFWFGYANSALNPILYAYFNRDFRAAFKKIICRCICQTERKSQPMVVPIFFSSLGEESDGNEQHNTSTFQQQQPRELV